MEQYKRQNSNDRLNNRKLNTFVFQELMLIEFKKSCNDFDINWQL